MPASHSASFPSGNSPQPPHWPPAAATITRRQWHTTSGVRVLCMPVRSRPSRRKPMVSPALRSCRQLCPAMAPKTKSLRPLSVGSRPLLTTTSHTARLPLTIGSAMPKLMAGTERSSILVPGSLLPGFLLPISSSSTSLTIA